MTCTVAVIGGGPAGAICSLQLARSGVDVFLFERNPQREKPCGGGLTPRAMKWLPNWRTLSVDGTDITRWKLISPDGCPTHLELSDHIRIVSRRRLDSALRRLAVSAGATLIEETVRKLSRTSINGWRVNGRDVDIVVGAGGINDPLARRVGLSIPKARRGQAVGYFVPGRFPRQIICRFFPGLRGYAWWFPRPDHASLGIESFEVPFRPKQARSFLDRFIRQDLCHLSDPPKNIDLNHAKSYSWSEPIPTPEILKSRQLNGRNWLLVGDAAGLVDAVTGEGIPYALSSGRLAANAILSGDLSVYATIIKNKMIPDLISAARMSPLFYHSPFLRGSFFVLANSKTMQGITNDMAVGRQAYQWTKWRILQDAPHIIKDLGYYLIHKTKEKGVLHAS
jgi:geranylgeranyl reductase family protein